MARLIDSGELLEQIDKYMAMTLYGCTFRGGKIPPMMLEMRQAVLCDVKQLIYSAPTIDAAPVRRGEWKLSYSTTINADRWSIDAICSECFFEKGEIGSAEFLPETPHDIALEAVRNIAKSLDTDNFCPNCGADMRKEEHHEPED